MLFTYKINIEVTSEFIAPILGADMTSYRREMIDDYLRKAFDEIMSNSVSLSNQTYDKVLLDHKEENLKVVIKCNKNLNKVK
jgi:hypothetical protein